MSDDPTTLPEWNAPLTLRITPAQLAHAIFFSARSVHTGWQSCIDPQFVVFELGTTDASEGHHARFVEQEYVSDEDEESWHDWGVEIRIGNLYVTAHWQASAEVGPADWDWCLREAEQAFERVCVLLGKRVRKGLVVEELESEAASMAMAFENVGPDRPRHH